MKGDNLKGLGFCCRKFEYEGFLSKKLKKFGLLLHKTWKFWIFFYEVDLKLIVGFD